MKIQRLWFYFRLGHGAYLGLLVGLAQFLIISYVLFLQRFPGLQSVKFSYFVLPFIVAYTMACIVVGFAHRRWQLGTETDIATVTNPYTYRIQPGKEREVFMPMAELSLRTNKLLLGQLGLLSPEIEQELDQLLLKIHRLQEGEEFR